MVSFLLYTFYHNMRRAGISKCGSCTCWCLRDMGVQASVVQLIIDSEADGASKSPPGCEHGHAGCVFLGEVCLKWCRNHEGHGPDLSPPSGGAFSLPGDHSQTGLSVPSLLSWRSTHTLPVSTQENLASVTPCNSPDVSRVSPPPPRNLGPPSRGTWGRFGHGHRLVTPPPG